MIFVNDVDKCYRLKLFLQQFYISAAVLNAEVPLNSRLHILEEYNRGVFDYLIATDACIDQGEEAEDDDDNVDYEIEDEEEIDNDEVVDLEGGEADSHGEDEEGFEGDSNSDEVDDEEERDEEERDDGFEYPDDPSSEEDESQLNSKEKKRPRVKVTNSEVSKKASSSKADYGVSRGIDFQGVTFVVNFDMPPTCAAYTHRIGRTARGGASGTSLSFVSTAIPKVNSKQEIETAKRDARILQQVRSQQPRLGTIEGDNVLAAIGSIVDLNGTETDDEYKMQPAPLLFNFKELDNFRYRVEDTLRSVTKAAVKELRIAEIKREILNSAKLKTYFAENPNDLKVLRHDKAIAHPIAPKEHLKFVPDYLIPTSMRGIAGTHTGQRKTKRRKVSQGGVSIDSKVRSSKLKDPLLNLPVDAAADTTAQEQQGTIADKNAAGENLYTWKESQSYSTSGRQKWKQRHRKGDFNPKQKAPQKMPGSMVKRKKRGGV